MKVDYFNSFDENPGTIVMNNENGGGNIAVYNLSARAVDVPANSPFMVGLDYLQKAKFENICVCEVDLEMLADSNGGRFIGIALVENFKQYLTSAYMFYHTGSSWGAILANGRVAIDYYKSTPLYLTPLSNPTFNIGDRRILRMEHQYGYTTCYVDGVKIFSFTRTDVAGFMPGIIGSSSVRIHSIKFQVGDDVVIIPSIISAEIAWANSENKAQAWPGDMQIKPAGAVASKISSVLTPKHLLSPPIRSDFGFIAGQVTRKKVPAAGQLVYCFDERFNLVAEKVSDANGMYRFDGLLKQKLYTVIAQDNFDFKYAPVGADRRTPESYP